MTFTHIDLIGLNKFEMEDAPIVSGKDELITLAEKSKAAGKSISIAGMRHSQGGHTAFEGGRMVFTEAMKADIHVDTDKMEVTVNAGATWSDLHFVLGPLGLAPLVHQSSPHFSIGGSLSVDCHGREVHEGALSNTVESIKILTNKKSKGFRETNASRNENPDLFFAALGGYGACGVILEATLRITSNIRLVKFGTKTESLSELGEYLNTAILKKRKLPDRVPPQDIFMFYAWMDVTNNANQYLKHGMVYEYYKEKPQGGHEMRERFFKNEGWGTSEAMRAAWVAGRTNPKLRTDLFTYISQKTKQSPTGADFLINYMREEISFMSTKGGATDVDILQEYFVPFNNIKKFLEELVEIFPYPVDEKAETEAVAVLLSCTLRVIQPNKYVDAPFLSYSKENLVMISVALEIKVKKIINAKTSLINFPDFDIDTSARDMLSRAINLAKSHGGSYYLPYYPIAELPQFRNAYINHSKWKKQADIWNPETDGKRVFDNEFLRKYLI